MVRLFRDASVISDGLSHDPHVLQVGDDVGGHKCEEWNF